MFKVNKAINGIVMGTCIIVSGQTATESGSEPDVPEPSAKTERSPDTLDLELQTNCPVLPGFDIDRRWFVEHDDKRIYACCGRCFGKVKKDPEKYIGLLQEMGQQPHMIRK